MKFFQYYKRVFSVAFTHSVDWTQAVAFSLLLISGLATRIFPNLKTLLDGVGWIAALGGWILPAWILIGVVLMRLLLTPYWIHREIIDSAQPHLDYAQLPPNTMHGALQIKTGHLEPFEHVTTFPSGTKRRTLRVGICNSGNGFLSNCYVYLTKIEPRIDSFGKSLLVGGFTLIPGECRYVDVVAFDEAYPQGMFGKGIVVCIPPSPMYNAWFVLPIDAENSLKHSLTIEATTTDSQSKQIECKTWIETKEGAARLRMEAL